MYKNLETQCDCGELMLEDIGYTDDESPKAKRAGWYCVNCEKFMKSILREQLVEEEEE